MAALKNTIENVRAEKQLHDTPLTVTTKRDLEYAKYPESAVTIPAGTKIDLYFSKLNPGRAYFEFGGYIRTTALVASHKSFTKINKPPSVRTLEKWEWDSGICKTVTGHTTEPDGYGPDGSPSWMLVIGVI